MFRTYRGKLAASFSLFIFLGLIITAICLVYNDKVRKLDKLTIQAEKTYGLILKDQKILGDFLKYAPTSNAFHSNENLPQLDRHQSLKKEIIQRLDSLENSIRNELNQVPSSIRSVKDLIKKNDGQIEEIKNLLLYRGFKIYGVEGKMRMNAHKLEVIPGFKKEEILSLRRHEKDYIIRYDKKYAQLLMEESDNMLAKLQTNPNYDQNQKEIATYHLETYVANFKRLVDVEDLIGLRNNESLKGEFNETQNNVLEALEHGIQNIEASKAILLLTFNTILTSCLAIVLLVCIFLGIYLSNTLTRRIKWLSRDINSFILNGFPEKSEQNTPKLKKDEIGILIQNFSLLKKRISSHIKELKKEKEAADMANKSKSLFLANMSHEIRTPMNGVIGITQMLEASEMNATQRNYVEILKISGQKLLGIINDILDFSKIESGELELEDTQLGIRDEIYKVNQLLSFKAKEKKLDFQLNIDPELPEFVSGDPVRFNQVLFNLVSNAIKFTQKGFVRVNAEVLKQDGACITILLQVEDSGIGISSVAQKKLFTAFSQADESTTRKYGGTGLGLAISFQLVKLMGGEISVKSTPGIGSTFTVVLNFKQNKRTLNYPEQKGPNGYKPGNTNVLLVEDNEVNQRVAEIMLKKIGCTFQVCTNGLEAVEEVQKNYYDLVFMDIQMPVMDGFEATTIIRELQAREIIRKFPIIALTANATEEDKKTAEKSGMDDFITKPIKIDRLSGIIAKYTSIPQKDGSLST